MLIVFLILQIINTASFWTIVIAFISALATAVWSLISMYFKSIAMNTEIAQLKTTVNIERVQLENKLKEEVTRVNNLLDEHKESTSKNIDKLYKRIDDMRDLIIETNTYCKILLGDKIKK